MPGLVFPQGDWVLTLRELSFPGRNGGERHQTELKSVSKTIWNLGMSDDGSRCGRARETERLALNMVARICQLRGGKLELPCVKIKERHILGGKTAGQGHCDSKS